MHGGRPVSFIGTDLQDYISCGCRIPVACLGGVCTHPDYRRRGLARELLDLAYRGSRAKGCLMVMISGGIDLYYRTGAAAGVFAMLQWRADAAAYDSPDEATAVQTIFAVPEVYQEKITDCPPPVREALRRTLPVPVRHYGLNFI
ncbi:MAG: GNAT family N-acetyltransferase [Anaerolineaceae bacterium]|nr:GNAT family N-acetyltransferase [Anaerolineaceae bacterium]